MEKTTHTAADASDRHAAALANRLLVDRFMKQVVNSFGYPYSRSRASGPRMKTNALEGIEISGERVNLVG